MRKKLNELRRLLAVAVIIQAGLLVFFRTGLNRSITTAAIILIVEAVLLYFSTDRFVSLITDHSTEIQAVLGTSAEEAFLFGEVGMVHYDEEHVITWMSELFEQRGINRVGTKVLAWLPEADDLINGRSDIAQVELDERSYQITRKEDEAVLFFRDVTDMIRYQKAYEQGMPVVGMASLDNYEESTQYEDETVVSAINVAVRSPLTEYCKNHGIMVKRVNNYRYLLLLNERIFNDLAADRFSILNTVRRAAQKQDVSITLSMAFARGTENYQELDDMVTRLMDLAQSRGGDQVAVQVAGEDVKYFGGSSEAAEKRSRVRVRVMAHTLRELISRSSNVIICGHKEADFDCIGSAIGMAKVSQALRRQAVIIARTGGIEEKLAQVMEEHKEELRQELTFVTESEALNQLQENTLVIMVDHHNVRQSNGARVLEQAKNVVIIDHHRRSSEMGVKPVLVYIEAGASSACELVTELIPYISNRAEITELEATIMLAGMTVDTGHFRVRTGARTYDAASTLRRFGADPLAVDEYLKDSYEQFAQKAAVMNMSERMDRGIVIAPVRGMILSRSMMSQAADSLLEIQGVEAAFVLANNTDGETAISARSAGRVNVQRIMEKMQGGGHMTAAAMQRPRTDIEEVRKELIDTIEEYFREVHQNEGNSEK
ncbi:MAG: DHH family phosphoesterase [Solobacterium sp.]|nr:DHH family phosphoesterase [Solobacterium sp.]MBQ1320644.1 DHH family phosphoesterase [Solobacterium sp.]MBQ1354945.1 DHH family phosphoesterase [Solobacterium sp.]